MQAYTSKLGLLLYSKRPLTRVPLETESVAFGVLATLIESGCVAVRPRSRRRQADRPGFWAFCTGLRQMLTIAPHTAAYISTAHTRPECLLAIEHGGPSGDVVLRLDPRLHALADDPSPPVVLDDGRANFMHAGRLGGWEALLDRMDADRTPVMSSTLPLNLGRLLSVWGFHALGSVQTDALH